MVVCWLLVSLTATAQNPEQVYADERIEKRRAAADWSALTEGIDYSEGQKEEAAVAEEEQGDRYNEVRRRERSIFFGDGLAKAIFVFLSVIGVAIIIALLLRYVLGIELSPKDKKLKNRATVGALRLEDIEENIHESDLEEYIQRALSEQQYALAIRLYYLAILKELSLVKAIQWKRDKTNRQYLAEMKQTALATPFSEATRIFEWAWYGNHVMDEEDYHRLAPKFKNMVEQARNLK